MAGERSSTCMSTQPNATTVPPAAVAPPPARPAPDRFAFHLTLLLLLTILPALGLAIHTGFEQRRAGIEQAKEQAALQARLAAAKQDRLFDNTRQMLAALADLSAINSTNALFWTSNFKNMLLLQPQYVNFGLLETNGRLFASAQPVSGRPDFSGTSYYREVIRKGEFVVGEYEPGRLTNQATLTFAHPVRRGKAALTRILFATVDISLIGRLAAEMPLPKEFSLLVLDRAGHVLSYSPNSQGWLGQAVGESVLFQTMVTEQEGTAELPGLDGVRRLYAFAPLRTTGDAGLFLAVGVTKEVAYASANKTLLRNLGLMVLTAVLALGAARLYARQYLLRPVRVLTESAQRLAAGDLSVRTGLKGEADLNQLAQTFDHMAEALQRRQAEIDRAGQQIQAMNTDLERRIAERKQAEKQIRASLREKEVLLKEIHHRVKNNLQVVSSLLRLQAHSLKNADALAAFEESCIRVQSMALVHEKLYQSSDLSELDFATYAPSLTDSLMSAFGTDPSVICLQLDVERVSLDINQAIPCALILNELVSNALKYAFPNGRSGEIRLRMHRDAAGQVSLVVSDNGVGLPVDYAPDKAETLGLQLVHTLARQLRGSIEVSRAAGTQFTLTFLAEPPAGPPKERDA